MICAVIVSYNSNKVFRCFESVKKQADKILIVDNGSKDADFLNYLKELETSNDNLTVIFNSENLGIASALNAGVKYAGSLKADWLLTLDDDSELPENTVLNIFSEFNELPKGTKDKCGLLALKYVERNTNDTGLPRRYAPRNDDFKTVKYALTSGNFIKMSAFEKIGLFEEKLFIDQVDNDFDFRLRKNGFTLLESQNSYILHEIGISQKKLGFTIRNYSPVRRYYLSRNCVYILKKYLFFDTASVLRIFIGSICGGIFKITLFEKQKLPKYKYILFGLIDGILNKYCNKYNP